jgi:hypothetical protein
VRRSRAVRLRRQSKLRVTIGSAPFERRLHHFELALSRCEYACVIAGGDEKKNLQLIC